MVIAVVARGVTAPIAAVEHHLRRGPADEEVARLEAVEVAADAVAEAIEARHHPSTAVSESRAPFDLRLDDGPRLERHWVALQAITVDVERRPLYLDT